MGDIIHDEVKSWVGDEIHDSRLDRLFVQGT